MSLPSVVFHFLNNCIRTDASTIWLFRMSPTLNIRHNLPSLGAMTAYSENITVFIRSRGWDSFAKVKPSKNASKIMPISDCICNMIVPSGHLDVIALVPYPMVCSVSMENRKAVVQSSTSIYKRINYIIYLFQLNFCIILGLYLLWSFQLWFHV